MRGSSRGSGHVRNNCAGVLSHTTRVPRLNRGEERCKVQGATRRWRAWRLKAQRQHPAGQWQHSRRFRPPSRRLLDAALHARLIPRQWIATTQSHPRPNQHVPGRALWRLYMSVAPPSPKCFTLVSEGARLAAGFLSMTDCFGRVRRPSRLGHHVTCPARRGGLAAG